MVRFAQRLPVRKPNKGEVLVTRLLLLLTLLAGLALSSAPLAAAQEGEEDVDVTAIAETVLAADPEALVEALVDPPADADLPEGFLNPPDGTPANADLAENFQIPESEFPDAVGSINFPFDTDAEVIPGLVSAGYLNYVVLEEEITDEQLDEFRQGVEEGLGTPDAAIQSSVEDLTVGGVDGLLISVVTTQESVSAVVQLVVLPVGNTFVIGTALVADQGEVDQDEVQTFAEDLTLTGAEHLGMVAEGAQ